MKKMPLLLVLLIALVGCVSTRMISPEAKSRIFTIHINPEVIVNEKPIFVGPGAAFGLMGALAEQDSACRLKTFARANDIDIGQIAKTEFSKAFSKSGPFAVTDSKICDATLNIHVKQYGVIGKRQSLTLYLYHGILCLIANLTDQNGKVVWQQYGNGPKNGESFTIDEIFEDPEILRSAWTADVTNAVKKILQNL